MYGLLLGVPTKRRQLRQRRKICAQVCAELNTVVSADAEYVCMYLSGKNI